MAASPAFRAAKNTDCPPLPGSPVCIFRQTPLDAVIEHLQKHDHKMIEDSIERARVTGPVQSVYRIDPGKTGATATSGKRGNKNDDAVGAGTNGRACGLARAAIAKRGWRL